MAYIFEFLRAWPIVPVAMLYVSLIFTIIAYIYVRRLRRARYFVKRDNHVFFARMNWPSIISGDIPASRWRKDPLEREVIETMLLDKISVASGTELFQLLGLLRSSGLLDQRLHEARRGRKWGKRTALIALGATRAQEAVGPLLEALDSADLQLRTAAVRGLGAIANADAALPILERLTTGELKVPPATISTALVSCCEHRPVTLLRYFYLTQGENRELIARVLAECELETLGEELLSLARDGNPEIRACSARGLPKLDPALAVPVLADLSVDDCWFVRLRAVVSLGCVDHPAAIDPLLQALCDSNRLVRQRAAAALVRRSSQIGEIVSQAVGMNDAYGLQALVSEMERKGTSEATLRELRLRDNASLSSAIVNAREGLKLVGAGAR
jgi:hypothetical protein